MKKISVKKGRPLSAVPFSGSVPGSDVTVFTQSAPARTPKSMRERKPGALNISSLPYSVFIAPRMPTPPYMPAKGWIVRRSRMWKW